MRFQTALRVGPRRENQTTIASQSIGARLKPSMFNASPAIGSVKQLIGREFVLASIRSNYTVPGFFAENNNDGNVSR